MGHRIACLPEMPGPFCAGAEDSEISSSALSLDSGIAVTGGFSE